MRSAKNRYGVVTEHLKRLARAAEILGQTERPGIEYPEGERREVRRVFNRIRRETIKYFVSHWCDAPQGDA